MRDQVRDRLLVAQVADDNVRLSARSLDSVLCARVLGVSLDEDDIRACFRQSEGDFSPDATGTAGSSAVSGRSRAVNTSAQGSTSHVLY